ncbi:zinc finger, RING/FYVE/PHD-type [Artemisia annua]|uniref:Zinc finger, RING/FYVE/PHD-type n=1 Tax=Artemisia annua TaxID=35608 RepID=A0A2U1NTH2_ARTAN|nr:zinc finger, RING/FYVE/PHD-type [Artemisia annua]
MEDIPESSNAANKRRRVEIMNHTSGVPFTNPITQFPSMHLLGQQQNRNVTRLFGTDLEVSLSAENDIVSSLMPHQNVVVSFHMNQMLRSLEDFWRSNLSEELKKIKEMETRIKEKEEQLDLFKQMYQYYEQKTSQLELTLWRTNREIYNTPAPTFVRPEEVQSCLGDLNNAQRTEMACKECDSRPATMMWLPCRHLCVCFPCDEKIMICPICNVKKTESFMINLR